MRATRAHTYFTTSRQAQKRHLRPSVNVSLTLLDNEITFYIILQDLTIPQNAQNLNMYSVAAPRSRFGLLLFEFYFYFLLGISLHCHIDNIW